MMHLKVLKNQDNARKKEVIGENKWTKNTTKKSMKARPSASLL
jgi:hypothetical protein